MELYNPTSGRRGAPSELERDETSDISTDEAQVGIRALKPGKAAGIDEIRPEMLKSLSRHGMIWLTRVCRVAWREGRAPVDWQTGIVVPIFKKGDRRECSNYRGITLLSLPGKVHARVLERKCRTIVEPKIQDTQCGFRPGRGTTDQLFTLRQVFEKAWEFAKPVYTAFIDLEKAYDRVPRDLLWSVLKEYGISGRLLAAIRSLYNDCKSHVRINGSKSDSFRVRVALRQGCVVSTPVHYFYGQDLPEKHHTRHCVTMGNARVESLRFADDIARVVSSGAGLQRALDRFVAECTMAGMQISTKKIEVMVLSRQKKQCAVNVNGTPLDQVEKFKYLGVEFSNEERLDCEIDRRIGSASEILRSLYRSVVTKKEVSRRRKMAIFNAVYRPALIYGDEQWRMTERIRSRIRAAQMRFFRRAAGLTLRDRIRSSTILESLKAESLLLHIERSQLRWLGHVLTMPRERLAHQVFEAMPKGKRPVGRPRLTWRNYVARLCQERLGLTRTDVISSVKDRNRWKRLSDTLTTSTRKEKRKRK